MNKFWEIFFITIAAVDVILAGQGCSTMMAQKEMMREIALEEQAAKIAWKPVARTETRKVVAIIDTGADFDHPDLKPFFCDGGHRDFTGLGLNDTHGHGTHIAGLITKGLDPKKVCIIVLRYYTSGGYRNFTNEVSAMIWAGKQGAALVNFSSGGFDPGTGVETETIRNLVMAGTKVVVAAGNDGQDLGKKCDYFPACSLKIEGFYVVENLNKAGQRCPSSNHGGPVNASAPGLMQYSALPGGHHGTMSGTSQATANYSNKLLGGKGESWTSIWDK